MDFFFWLRINLTARDKNDQKLFVYLNLDE